ncbi:MAG: hypothetical protein RLY57_372 [Candidatus Parcubacteria bacterium]|jgi:hypothetical protein
MSQIIYDGTLKVLDIIMVQTNPEMKGAPSGSSSQFSKRKGPNVLDLIRKSPPLLRQRG